MASIFNTGKTCQKLPLGQIVLSLGLLTIATFSHAQTILTDADSDGYAEGDDRTGIDQEYKRDQPTTDGLRFSSSNATFQAFGQGFTSGYSGALTQVRLPVTCDAGSNLIVTIVPVDATGVPNGAAVDSITLDAVPASTGANKFPIIDLTPDGTHTTFKGERLAVTLGVAGACLLKYTSNQDNGYADGIQIRSTNGSRFSVDARFDFPFATVINADLDKCPSTPMDETANSDGCGPSQPDSDGDGTYDHDDDDDDGDGVLDAVDEQCPLTPQAEKDQVISDSNAANYGCGPSRRDTDSDGDNDNVDLDDDDDNVSDPADKCPLTTLTAEERVFVSLTGAFRGCGPTERDTDGDNVNDEEDLDDDDDEVRDINDNCLNNVGLTLTDATVNADGCPDTDGDETYDDTDTDDDGDGVLDVDDQCPLTTLTDELKVDIAPSGDFQGCGEGERDTDGDGDNDDVDDDDDGDQVLDDNDECPRTVGIIVTVDTGCPDTDDDGITDPADLCPINTPAAAVINTDGCHATQITATNPGVSLSTIVNSTFGANALVVTLLDKNAVAVPGVAVTFAVASTNAAEAVLSTIAPVTTDADGVAEVIARANRITGIYAITASAVGIAEPFTFSVTNTPGAAANLATTPLGDGGNSRGYGEAFPELQVAVSDEFMNAVNAGLTVNFTATAGANGATASLSASRFPIEIADGIAVLTDENGVATALATAGDSTGDYSVTAALDGVTPAVSATFSLANTKGGAMIEKVNSEDLMFTVDDDFPDGALNVTVRNSDMAQVGAGVGVIFTVQPSGFIGLKINDADTASDRVTARTNDSGIASVIATATGMIGSYTVTAALATDETIATVFNSANTIGVASQMIIAPEAGFQSTVKDTQFASPLALIVADQFGNGVPEITVEFTSTRSGATATLITADDDTKLFERTMTTDAAGRASVIAIATTSFLSTYTVTATSMVDGVPIVGEFDLSNTNKKPATIVEAGTAEPADRSAIVGADFSSNLSVTVHDKNGVSVPRAAVTFTVMPAENGAAANLGLAAGATPPTEPILIAQKFTDGNGFASFTAMANTIAGDYAVLASVAVEGVETTFNLSNTAKAAMKIIKNAGDEQSVLIGEESAPLVVTVVDEHGNPIADDESKTVTFALVPPADADNASATLPAITTLTTTDGVAMLLSVTADQVPGTYRINVTHSDRDNENNAITATFTLNNIEPLTPLTPITPADSSFCFPVMGETSTAVVCL